MPNPILSTAIAIARRAGALLVDGNGSRAATFKLNEIDLVTEYDRRSETLIVAALHEAFPDHAIRAEEGALINSGADPDELQAFVDTLRANDAALSEAIKARTAAVNEPAPVPVEPQVQPES